MSSVNMGDPCGVRRQNVEGQAARVTAAALFLTRAARVMDGTGVFAEEKKALLLLLFPKYASARPAKGAAVVRVTEFATPE
ncbi:hypothetical protein [Marinovum sp.]|uniref:hypothetical protein n=1 Tax=Marinovum sp. TaxID=2024839 RepID=UPI003A8E2567